MTRIPTPERHGPGRERVIPTLVGILEELAVLRAMLERIEARPPQVVQVVREWRPDHRRLADGGQPVRVQRKRIREEVA